MKNNIPPKSFLDEVYNSIKSLIDGPTAETVQIIDLETFARVRKESTLLLNLAEQLNNDPKLMDQINLPRKSSIGLNTKQLILSELIHIYGLFPVKEGALSKFVLAYYYDVLRNDNFADERNLAEYNQLISTEKFDKLMADIKVENSLKTSAENSKAFPLSGILANHNPELYASILIHYENFIFNAFGLKFNKKENFGDVLGIIKMDLKAENKMTSTILEEDSLEIVLKELNALVGLKSVKKDIADLINFLDVQKKREQKGLKNTEITLHTVFLGPPGTGKTTVARLLGRIFKHLGYLTKGQMLETDREGLIAGYVGQTAGKVDKAVEESLGGVLFIDEAYALNQNAFGNDYGSEAISALLKRMEDNRSDLAVVVAGYTDPMKLFIESNPGLRSRFNRYFHFDHFKPEELIEIYKSFCKQNDFTTNAEADEKLLATFEMCYEKRDDGFGNARDVRNIFEICVRNHANRIVKLKSLSKKVLKTITENDVPEPKETLAHIQFFSTEE